jgi:plastocyanin
VRKWLPLLAVAALAGAEAQATPAEAQAAPAPTVVTVSMHEWGFTLAPRQVPRGAVLFRVRNRGTIRHNFVIAGKRTPALAPGWSKTFRVTFRRPARHAFVCTLPSHAEAGMKGFLQVV